MVLTDKMMQDVLDDMIILVDTREQKNQHILDFLNKNKLQYKIEKLETGDYSFILPHYPQLLVDKKFLIEKKNSLDEIVGNFTKDRERFTREFERIGQDQKMHLVIENATWKKLLKGSYRSKYPSKSFMASLMTFSIRYGVPYHFVQPEESPLIIYSLLRYELLEHLKNLRKGDK